MRSLLTNRNRTGALSSVIAEIADDIKYALRREPIQAWLKRKTLNTSAVNWITKGIKWAG